jgi:hypothetical protein
VEPISSKDSGSFGILWDIRVWIRQVVGGVYTIEDMGNGKGYLLMKGNGKFLSIDGSGVIDIISQAAGFQGFSVTYQ